MSQLTFYAHPKCSTCERAREWLQRNKVDFVEKDIRVTPPKIAELRAMLAAPRQGGEVRRLGNTSGIEYRALGLSAKLPTMTGDEVLRLFAGNGMLVKRPFLIGPSVALIGFKEPDWAATLAR